MKGKNQFIIRMIVVIVGIILIFIGLIREANSNEIQQSNLTQKENVINYIQKINKKVYPELADLIYESIITASDEFKIDPIIVLCLIHQESTFYTNAISWADCIGLMQINYKIWDKTLRKNKIITSKFDYYNPRINIRCGVFILSHYLEIENGDYKKALQRYYGNRKGSKYSDKIFTKVKKYYINLKGK